MADDKKAEPIELIAVERGFVMGRLIEPGRKFMFRPVNEDGTPRRLPKWAQLADKPLPKKPKHSGDLKPKDTQAAVRIKTGVDSGSDLA
jgi:hypothetical protein